MGDRDRDVNARGRQLWSRRAGRELSVDDVREINHNLTGFFRLLAEWDEAAERAPGAPEHGQQAEEPVAIKEVVKRR